MMLVFQIWIHTRHNWAEALHEHHLRGVLGMQCCLTPPWDPNFFRARPL